MDEKDRISWEIRNNNPLVSIFHPVLGRIGVRIDFLVEPYAYANWDRYVEFRRLAIEQGVFKEARMRPEEEEEWFLFTTTAATLRELWDQNPDLFCPDNYWWLDQPFAIKKGKAGRLFLRTSAQPRSFGRSWERQRRLLPKGVYVPTTRDLVEGMIAYYRETGKKLFSEYWVRTSDVVVFDSDPDDEFPDDESDEELLVDVYFYPDGVCVSKTWDDNDHLGIGLSVVRKAERNRRSSK